MYPDTNPRKFAGGNLFSNSHRHLPPEFQMYDVDSILTLENAIVAVVEYKFKINSKKLKSNIIKDKWSPQRSYLQKTFHPRGVEVWVHEESSENQWKLNHGGRFESHELNLREYTEFLLDDRYYIETRKGKPLFAWFRTNNERDTELQKFAQNLSEFLRIDMILVNDTFKKDLIYFKKPDVVKPLILENLDSRGHWFEIYQKLGY